MNETPFVSVCIQTYQHKKFIRQCIESVLMQKTDFSFEIIIGEDDSTDGTREICVDFAEKYPEKIRLFLRSEKDKIYIHGEKTGRFNFLSNLQAARGKYIALLDGDDAWCHEYKLQKQVSWMEANPGMVITTHNLYWTKENETPYINYLKKFEEDCRVFSLDDLCKDYFLWMSAIVFRRSTIEDLPHWFKDVLFIDYPLSLHIAQKGSIGYMKEPMGIYHIHKAGAWSLRSPLENEIRLWKFYTLLASNFTGAVQRAMQRWRRDRGKWLIHFYRAHLWYSSSWLKNDLLQHKFPEDRHLLRELNYPLRVNDYKANIKNALKRIKKVFRKN